MLIMCIWIQTTIATLTTSADFMSANSHNNILWSIRNRRQNRGRPQYIGLAYKCLAYKFPN